MNRRGVWVVMLVTALAALVCVPRAWGQRPPETHPVSTHEDVVASWDRSSRPSNVELWTSKKLIAYDASMPASPYATSHIVCSSEEDSTNGSCPTSGRNLTSGYGTIYLKFREVRSGLETLVGLQGALTRAMTGQACSSDYWHASKRHLWSNSLDRCASDQPAGLGVELFITGTELDRLVAGHWLADLRLELVGIEGGGNVKYDFSLDFTITDHNAVSIYFPQYESTTPLVNLDARYDPIRQTLEGRVVVDMCLYDGLGSQASYLAVTARDTTSRPPGPSGFSLWHETSGSDDSQRLDYTITLDHNGTPVPLANGVEERLGGIDSARLRLVMLPGMSQPVFCVPTPMTLDMPRVPSPSKRPGTYWGDLTVELRVPAAVP